MIEELLEDVESLPLAGATEMDSEPVSLLVELMDDECEERLVPGSKIEDRLVIDFFVALLDEPEDVGELTVLDVLELTNVADLELEPRLTVVVDPLIVVLLDPLEVDFVLELDRERLEAFEVTVVFEPDCGVLTDFDELLVPDEPEWVTEEVDALGLDALELRDVALLGILVDAA